MSLLMKYKTLDSKELEFIKKIENLTKVKCHTEKKIDWKSSKIGSEKSTNAVFKVVIKNDKITEFAIAGARFQEFPKIEGIFTELKKLFIIKSSLEIFPESICELSNLTQLDISYNNIKEIPNSIENLKNLQSINLTQNLVKKIPIKILNLPTLEAIQITGNPIEDLPIDYPNLNNLINKYQNRGLIKSEAEVLAYLELITGENIKQVHHRGILNGYYLQNKTIIWLRLFSVNLKSLPRIISNLTNLKTLNLSGEPPREEEGVIGRRNGIQFLPKTIGELKTLKWLYLSKSMLNKIPEEIGTLSNLQQLYLSDNFIEEIPSSLKNLNSLKYLDLQKNNLKEIPAWIASLDSLQKLNLSNNEISKIPNELSKLQNLKSLILNNNFIQDISVSLGNINQLLQLDLSNNALVSESLEPIYNLKNLKLLDISFNSDISSLAKSIENLSNLEYLNIEGNQFINIPTSIWSLSKLKELNLKKNPWNDESLELMNRDLQSILEYCRKKANIHIFLSHVVEDFERFKLLELINFLENQSEIYEVMYCERDLTGNIDQFMRENIPKSNLLLFLATKKSVFDSDDCRTEIELARENDIEIIPIKSDEVTWDELRNVGLKRELGKEFSDNIEILGANLYDYIKNLKRNINLFEKEQAKVDKIKLKIKKEFDRIISSSQAEDYIKTHYEKILEDIESEENYKENIQDLLNRLMKIDI